MCNRIPIRTDRFFKRFSRRSPVTVKLLSPILPDPDDTPLSLTNRLMFTLAGGLPESMRGMYAECQKDLEDDCDIIPKNCKDGANIMMQEGLGNSTPVQNKLIPFLCYAREDKNIIREFSQRLKSEGWIDPWFDEEDILPGQVWKNSVINAVRQSHAVIVFLSRIAVASEGFFQKELKLAMDTAAEKPEGTIFIIPIRIDECDVPEMLTKYQYVDYFGDSEQKTRVYSSLIASLRNRAENLGIPL